jgi:purine-binding chemotaxis protein CheW
MNQLSSINASIKEGTKELYLIFSLQDKDYGIGIYHLVEIIALLPITPLTDVPNYVKGVIDLRGKIIPVIDVRARMGMEEIAYHERTCIIIINIRDTVVGLIVDTVREVLRIPSDKLESTPVTHGKAADALIESITEVSGSVKILLKVENLLEELEFRTVQM